MRDNECVQSGLSKIGQVFQGGASSENTYENYNITSDTSKSSGGGMKEVIIHSLTIYTYAYFAVDFF